MLYLFKVRKSGHFFGPWTTIQENGSGLLCDIIAVFIHARNKQKQSEIIFSDLPDSFIVFRCNNKSDSENGRALN